MKHASHKTKQQREHFLTEKKEIKIVGCLIDLILIDQTDCLISDR